MTVATPTGAQFWRDLGEAHVARRIFQVSGQLSGLLDWTAIDEILANQELVLPRTKLSLNGTLLPSSDFIQDGFVTPHRTPFSRNLFKHIRDGGILTIEGADELRSELRDVARRLERTLNSRVDITIDVRTCASDQPKWWPYDALVIQACGSRSWRVLGEGRPFPLSYDDPLMQEPPAAGAAREFILAEGDALYIPRGHWFESEVLRSPALTLRARLTRPTGIDFVHWLVEGAAKEKSILRMDVPTPTPPQYSGTYLDSLRKELAELLHSPDVHYMFLADWLGRTPARMEFESARELNGQELLFADPDAVIVVLVPHRIFVHEDAQTATVDIRANGRCVRLKRKCAGILRFIRDRHTFSIGEFYQAFSEGFDRSELSELLEDLGDLGIVGIQRRVNQVEAGKC